MNIIGWHYEIMSTVDKHSFMDSAKFEDFNGYDSAEKAHKVGRSRIAENRLHKEFVKVYVYPNIEE